MVITRINTTHGFVKAFFTRNNEISNGNIYSFVTIKAMYTKLKVGIEVDHSIQYSWSAL